MQLVEPARGLGKALIRNVSKALKSTISMVKDLAEGEGDLTKRLEIVTHDELGELAKWLNTFLDKIHQIIVQVAGTAEKVAVASEDLNSTSQQITTSAEETATQADVVTKAAKAVSQNLETVATGAEEMESSINEIAKNATEAAKVATSAVKVAETTTCYRFEAGRILDRDWSGHQSHYFDCPADQPAGFERNH